MVSKKSQSHLSCFSKQGLLSKLNNRNGSHFSKKIAAAGTGGKIKWTVLLTKFLEIAGH